jgi:SPP1 gp7 family putative phage head morphogenesis protein
LSELDYNPEDLYKAVYAGSVTPNKLPKKLYSEIAKILSNGMNEGFDTNFELGGKDEALLKSLADNVYRFSGAKTYQQVKDMGAELVRDGKIVSFKDFKSRADEIFNLYNKTWLKTEYETALGQAQNARKWNDFEADKELFPMLEYDAVMDANTSDICRPLNGIVLPVDDPFWNTHAPLNHFMCRCFLRKVDKYDDKKATSKAKAQKVAEEISPLMQPLFKSNSGKDGKLFDDKHPYFEAPKSKLKNNFGLPIPKK